MDDEMGRSVVREEESGWKDVFEAAGVSESQESAPFRLGTQAEAEQGTMNRDARYREARAHLQTGEWEEAIERFEALQRDYPESSEVTGALEGARFRAEMDAGAGIRARRWVIPWRPLIVGALILLTSLAIALQVASVVRGSVLPSLAEAQAERQRARWLTEGQDYLEAGQLDMAQSRFAAVLKEEPDNTLALQGMEEIAEQQMVHDLYNEAISLQSAGEDEQALALLAELSRRWPGYRDVADRIEALRRTRDIEELFAEAQAADQAGRTHEAIAAYEQVGTINLRYKRDVIEERLFELYMEAGQLIADGPREEELQQASVYFARALSLRPRSRRAALEHQLATRCLDGLESFREEAWGQAISRLQAIFEERPDYLGGVVVYRLYFAYVYLGEQYEAAGNVHLAYEHYQRALELPVDHALANRRATSLAPQLTPTPTATPAPSPSPTPVWRGTAVQEDQNLLTNPSFEGGWSDIYTGQAPEGWRILWLDGVRFPGAADIALAPETIVGHKERTPPRERDVLFLDGSQHLKVFRSFSPMYAAVVQDVSGLDVGRRYRLVVPIFVDLYIWNGRKVAPGGESGRIRLGAAPQGAVWRDEDAINYSEWWDGTNTEDFFLQYSEFTFDFEATQADMTVYIELVGIYGLNNNGFFLDDVALYPLGSP